MDVNRRCLVKWSELDVVGQVEADMEAIQKSTRTRPVYLGVLTSNTLHGHMVY